MFLSEIYRLLYNHYGFLNWWPGDTRDEIIIGAVLTQNTSWTQVEKAINNLETKNILSLDKILTTESDIIEEAVIPSGFFKQKTKYLKNTAEFFSQTDIMRLNPSEFRKQLLSVKGIGQETADSILLYAFNLPYFVIDAYTKRIFSRLGFCKKNVKYVELQEKFMSNKNVKPDIYNNFHAMIVNLAKDNCKTKPICSTCCLKAKCNYERYYESSNTKS